MTSDDHACALLLALCLSLAVNVVLGCKLAGARHNALTEATP